MSSTAGAVFLLVVLAVLMVGAFIVLWFRDRGRAQEEANDGDRIAPSPPVEGNERH